MKKIELLLPAGNKEAFQAAIAAGADAVYIGGKMFSARAFADNFTNEEIREWIAYAHIHGVKVHVGINTLIYEEEWNEVIAFLDFLYLADVDAVIVADFGLLSVLHHRYPGLSIHVSTQCNTHNLWQMKLWESYQVDRVVLARETSLKTIAYFKAHSPLELEVFAHGALCVCYSGNCLHSSMIGKRSGNRGSCAQPCRMEYELLENHRCISAKKYFLSMKDLNTISRIDELIQVGISSLKIEGRMKSPEYVHVVTKAYRKAIDDFIAHGKKFSDSSLQFQLKQIFSREFTEGYLFATKNVQMTNTFRPNHLGTKIGMVVKKNKNFISIRLQQTVYQHDKIVFVQPSGDIALQIAKLYHNNQLVNQASAGEIVELEVHSKIEIHALVYKAIDVQLQKEVQREMKTEERKVPVRMKVIANCHEKLTLIVEDFDQHIVQVQSSEPIQIAINCPTSKEKIAEQIRKVKNTAYCCADLKISTDQKGMIPVRQLNELRREAMEKLDMLRHTLYFRSNQMIQMLQFPSFPVRTIKFSLKVKVHCLDQLQAISQMTGIEEIYYDDLMTFEQAQKRFNHLKLIPVLPRIRFDDQVINFSSSTYVINQLGDLLQYQNEVKITDLYLNVTNVAQIVELLSMNVKSITLSPEMNRRQIRHLTETLQRQYAIDAPLEMVVYGRCQTMITNHCFIAKEFGYERKNCGCCRQKQYALRDRMNYEFPIRTDEHCQVTIYNSKILHLLEYLDEIRDFNIASVRLDFSFETPSEVTKITQAYLDRINRKTNKLALKDATYGYYLDE